MPENLSEDYSVFILTNTSVPQPHLALRGELTGVRSCEGVRQEPWRGLARGLYSVVWLEAAKAPISREAALAGRCLSIGTLVGVFGNLALQII